MIKLAFIDSSIGMMIKVPVHQQANALLIVINENRPKRAIYLATVKSSINASSLKSLLLLNKKLW